MTAYSYISLRGAATTCSMNTVLLFVLDMCIKFVHLYYSGAVSVFFFVVRGAVSVFLLLLLFGVGSWYFSIISFALTCSLHIYAALA